MRREFFILAVWTSVAGGLAGAEGTPKIEFDRTTYDFGRTSQVQLVRGKFIVRNAGDGVLKLDLPEPSCGCLTPSLSARTLQPGEQAELNFSVSLAPFRQLLAKQIALHSNDPKQPLATLEVRVDNVPLYDTDPRWINLADFRKGTTTNFVVSVQRTDGNSLALSSVATSSGWIAARLAAATNGDERMGRVLLDLKADGAPRLFSEYVYLYAENSNAAVATITLHGRIVGDVAWKPENLYWLIPDATLVHAQAPEHLVTRRLTLNFLPSAQTLEVLQATSSLKQVSVQVVPKEEGKSCEIVARLTEAPQGVTTGTITVETNSREDPRIAIPVTINVTSKQ